MPAPETKTDTFPLVAGVTETAKSDPGLQLTRLLEGRLPRPSRDRLAEAMDMLEGVFGDETDEPTKARVGAAIAMLRGSRSPKNAPTGPKKEAGTRG